MSASPSANTVPSQKRPLEEPSSPSGPGEQPDAKRPALDKMVKEEGADTEVSIADIKPVKNGDTDSAEEAKVDPQTEPAAAAVTSDTTQNGTKDGQGDTVIPDAVQNAIQTHPIESTSSVSANNPGQAGSRSNDDEKAYLHMRAIISSAEAATVIGKGGENVTTIRKMSGAKCTVSDYTRGAVERILTVSGHVDAVAKSFGLIIRTLNNEPLDQPSNPQSKTYPLRLLIPHILIGSIIGKQGVRIREIQDASGARLNVSDSTLPLSTERSLVILGVADAVHIATYYVGSTLGEQLNNRFGSAAASAYATRSGGPASVVPGGLQVTPYVPQPAGGQWGHPDTYRGLRGVAPTVRTPAHYGTTGYAQPGQPHHAGMHYGPGSPRAGYPNAGPHQTAGYPQHATAPTPHVGAPANPMSGVMPGQPLTQQIFIPNDMVGAIIGKGGAKINEIRQLSGSVIKINEPQDNSNERLVTITGTQECNQMALYMLYQRLESEKHKHGKM